MKLTQLKVHNFGKLNDKEMTFKDGVNIVYGPNESGKTTLHEFTRGMFYGITRQRGRASRNDLYTRYEPWENSSYFSGLLRFESGGKDFRITRNFYKNDIKEEFVCETDGERLSVVHGDMDVLLGDVSETVFDNTISIGQMRSRTDESLYQELRNYMTNYEGSGDWSLDIQQAQKALKDQVKEYNSLQRSEKVRQEARKRELQMNINYLQNEIAQYEEKSSIAKSELATKRVAIQEKIQRKATMTAATEQSIDGNVGADISSNNTATRDGLGNQNAIRKKGLLAAILICVGFAILSAIVWGYRLGKLDAIWAAIGFVVTSAVAGIIFWLNSKKIGKTSLPGNKRKELIPQKDLRKEEVTDALATGETLHEKAIRAQTENIKLIEGKLAQLEEMHEEKKTQLDNCQMDYWEYSANTGETDDTQVEIDALQLAMDSINVISSTGTHRMEKQFHQRISDILKEITNGKYDRVVLDDNQEIELYSMEKQIPLWTLSKGTIEQVYFALRMAAAEIFCTEDMPIILDDVFVMYDEDRLLSALAWLANNKHQVIIFTCNTREIELAKRLNMRVNNINL